MVYLTVRNTSGGNHGHQLKDLIGGIAVARFFGFKYLHTYYPYLEFFGLGYGEDSVGTTPDDIDYIKLSGPFWNGISYENLIKVFEPIIEKYKENDVLVSIENALRLFPHQTIDWQRKGLVEKEILNEVITEISSKFRNKHREKETSFDKSKFNIAMHINRGQDYDQEKFPEHFSKHTNVRYMFPITYYQRIIEQLESSLSMKNYIIHIYTEEMNSEEIISTFQNNKNVELHIGKNRGDGDQKPAHSIFSDFVESDILIASNSSFSAMACYFRKNKFTIYHPHDHLDNLPIDDFIPTDESGNFDIKKLSDFDFYKAQAIL
jgi:hypothetical protein